MRLSLRLTRPSMRTAQHNNRLERTVRGPAAEPGRYKKYIDGVVKNVQWGGSR